MLFQFHIAAKLPFYVVFHVDHWSSTFKECEINSAVVMTSISKGKNTPIVLKDRLSLKSKLISYAIFFWLSSLPKSVALYCKKGR